MVVEHVVADPHASPFPASPAASISMLVSPLTMLCHDTYVVVNIDLGGDGGAKTSRTQVGHGNSFCLMDITTMSLLIILKWPPTSEAVVKILNPCLSLLMGKAKSGNPDSLNYACTAIVISQISSI